MRRAFFGGSRKSKLFSKLECGIVYVLVLTFSTVIYNSVLQQIKQLEVRKEALKCGMIAL